MIHNELELNLCTIEIKSIREEVRFFVYLFEIQLKRNIVFRDERERTLAIDTVTRRGDFTIDNFKLDNSASRPNQFP